MVTSLYFGGGTPALAATRIKEIVDALNEHFIITDGIGLELHPDNVNVETLQILKDAGVTKISIGIQSFCDKYQKILGRKKIDTSAMMSALAAVPFETVSMDFIFALPGQTYNDLKSDIDTAFWEQTTLPFILLLISLLQKVLLLQCPKKKSASCLMQLHNTA